MLTVNLFDSTTFTAQLNVSGMKKNAKQWKDAAKEFSHLTARNQNYTVSVSEAKNSISVKSIDPKTKKVLTQDTFTVEDGTQSLMDNGVTRAAKILKNVLKKVVKEKRFENQAYAYAAKIENAKTPAESSSQIMNINSLDEINQVLADYGIRQV